MGADQAKGVPWVSEDDRDAAGSGEDGGGVGDPPVYAGPEARPVKATLVIEEDGVILTVDLRAKSYKSHAQRDYAKHDFGGEYIYFKQPQDFAIEFLDTVGTMTQEKA